MGIIRMFRRLVSGLVIAALLTVTSGCISVGFIGSGHVRGLGDFGRAVNWAAGIGNAWGGYAGILFDLGVFVGVTSIDYLADVAYYSMEDGETPEQFSPEQEYYIGRGVSASLVDEFKMADLKNERTRRRMLYLNQMAGFIKVSNPDGASLWAGVRVGLLESKDVAAYATPGGFIWVTQGALDMVQTEEELAALLCHELGHVAHAHAIEAYRAANGEIKPNPWIRAAANKVGAFNSNFGNYLGGVAEQVAQNAYSVDQEYEADKWAVAALQLAGYSHRALFRLLERVQAWEKTHPQAGVYLKNHPPVADRIEELRDFVDDNEEIFKLEVSAGATKRQNARFELNIRK